MPHHPPAANTTKNINIMNYAYIRFSTDKQDERQQANTIENFLNLKGMALDKVEMDEGVSGGVSYKERKLYSLVQSMKKGDCLIVSEISRLGRSMSDLNKLVNDELKPRGVRLVVIAMGLDLDCSKLKAMDEMILFAFSFAGQLEKELIQDRTRNALEARKKAGIPIGGTNELWGKNTHSDRKEALAKASSEAAKARRSKALLNEANLAFKDFIEDFKMAHGGYIRREDWQTICDRLNSRGRTTATGLEFTPKRARAMYDKILNIYDND